MKVKVLSAAVSVLALAWLGVSFATQSEPTPDPRHDLLYSELEVDAEHPDSHRLGAIIDEEVSLPEWDTIESGSELALLAN